MGTARVVQWTLLIALLGFFSVCGLGAAPAPVPATTTEKWEYAELRVGRTTLRAPVAGQPAQAAQPMIHWVTSDEDMEVHGWEDLATKLKAPEAKMNVSSNTHRMRALNQLGAEGWELLARQPADGVRGSEVLTFKRKVKK